MHQFSNKNGIKIFDRRLIKQGVEKINTVHCKPKTRTKISEKLTKNRLAKRGKDTNRIFSTVIAIFHQKIGTQSKLNVIVELKINVIVTFYSKQAKLGRKSG